MGRSFWPRSFPRARAVDMARGMIAEAAVIFSDVEGSEALARFFLQVLVAIRRIDAVSNGDHHDATRP